MYIRRALLTHFFRPLHIRATFLAGFRPSTVRRLPQRIHAKTYATRSSKMAENNGSPDKIENTILRYQHDASILTLNTKITSFQRLSDLPEANRNLFKAADPDPEQDFILTTEETIFHPQGGGQPSDEGTVTILPPQTPEENKDATSSSPPTLEMRLARHSTQNADLVLHLVRFTTASSTTNLPTPSTPIILTVNPTKRTLYSRLHTAGHILGGAVRSCVSASIPDFDELKASHYPGSASCEFQGLISGDFKPAIQAKVDEIVASAEPVKISFWGREDFEREGLERLVPEGWDWEGDGNGGKLRVVRIGEVDVYPCGGTHVERTDLCGKVGLKKISWQKGGSRVGYTVD